MSALKKIHTFDEVFDTQKMFRIILTALSNPTKTLNVSKYSAKLHGQSPALLAVAMTLLDNEVAFNTCGDEALSEEIVSLTLAGFAELDEADFIFLTDLSKLGSAIERAKCGTLRDPHKSALLVVLLGDQKDALIRLTGPGIAETVGFETAKAVDEALRLRDARCDEYPQGIDFIFICGNGDLFALPRTTHREA